MRDGDRERERDENGRELWREKDVGLRVGVNV